jgi:[acyl-carrier-protein] S-malonyltransferase
MPARAFILCPGQGAQAVGMAKDLYETFPVAREVFDHARQILDWDLAAMCFNGPEEKLNQTDISQPAIFVASVASYRAAVEAGLFDPADIAACAGLSLGEYTALHLAGVFGFEEGLKLVAARGRYMQQAAVASPSGMVAVLGADEEAVAKLCREAAGGEVLVPANINAPGQIVVSGASGACERILAAAAASGFKATALKVAGAFHSPLMQPAADQMQAELDRVTFASPTTLVYSNVTAAPHSSPEAIKRRLVEQIVSPVLWERTMKTLVANPEARFVELCPGRSLAGLAKRINRRLPIESVATAESLAQLKQN